MKNIVIIGSANMDTTHYVKEFPNDLTAENENDIIETRRLLGGKGANQAVSTVLQSQGTDNKVFFIGFVGKDDAGVEIIKSLQERKIDYSGVKVLPDTKTDGRIILVNQNGENRMFGHGECIKQLTPDSLSDGRMKEVLESADIVMIQMKMPAETVEFVINYCCENNKKLLIDPTPIEKSSLLTEKELISKVTYLTPNEEEAYALAMYEQGKTREEIKKSMISITRDKRIEKIRELINKYPNIIATLGDKGVMYYNNGQIRQRDTYSTKCVDSTGAGDTFNGAFISAIARDTSFETAIDYALMDCANKVQYKGAQNGMQTRQQTEKDLEKINIH